MKEEQVSTAPRVLNSVLDKLLDRSRLVRAFDLLSARAKRECSLLLLDPHMPDAAIELDREGENVIQIGAIADDKASIWLVGENFLGCFGSQSAPIPATLKVNRQISVMSQSSSLVRVTSRTFSILAAKSMVVSRFFSTRGLLSDSAAFLSSRSRKSLDRLTA
jgi:hypothetical protein